MMLLGWAVHGQAAAAVQQADQANPPAGPEQGAHEANSKTPRDKPESGTHAMTAQQAAYRALEQFDGRVLSVKLEDGDDEPYYQVKLLKHGQVRVVEVNTQP